MKGALYASARMVTPNAILIAATLVILALLGVLAVGIHSGFRFLRTVVILKASPDAKSATAMLRADSEKKKEEQPMKLAMEMPATGIDELANSPEAIANLRTKQDPSADPY